MYLFVRQDLSVPQQIVQTAHAVDELNKRWDDKSDTTNFMVLCSVKDELELWKVGEYLASKGIFHHMFYEPDIEASTAIATRPLRGIEREALSKFQTMKL